MLIVCPTCATAYQVDPAALGAAGRSVRCSRCQAQWFASPPELATTAEAGPAGVEADDSAQVAAFRSELGGGPPETMEAEPAPPEAAPGPDAPALAPGPAEAPPPGPSLDDLMSTTGPALAPAAQPDADGTPAGAPDVALPMADAPPLAPLDADGPPPPREPEEDIETVARRRSLREARKRKRPSRLPLVLVGLAAILASLLIWRGKVVQHAPQMAGLYAAIGLPVNLRGLTFTEVATTKDSHDGVPVLVVEGKIVNTASSAVEVPRLRFAVQNASGGEIYAWTAQPAQAVLGAGEVLPFRSRLASPPAESHSVIVRFFNRRDAAAGLR